VTGENSCTEETLKLAYGSAVFDQASVFLLECALRLRFSMRN
jgi:hypothetical protein